ncbi:hypothetical protein Tco_1249502, partial [Tanacetum coccineum]
WWCRYDDDDDGGGVAVMMMMTVVVWLWRGDEWVVVTARDMGDRVDPVVRITFGLGRKTPPEKFSGDGGGGGSPKREREQGGVCVVFYQK